MYRLTGPNLLIFIPIIIIGTIVTTIIPNYMGANRILSFSSLLIGEVGMSFIPVLAFFPKATLIQIATLACIYLLNTLVICVATWGIYTLGFVDRFALLWTDNSFHINTYALFVANIFSLGNLVLCFKLIYDEELAKEFQSKKKSIRHQTKFGLGGFKSPLLKRPSMGDFGGGGKEPPLPTSRNQTTTSSSPSSQQKGDLLLDEEIEKPFQFEPDISESSDPLPEESSGGLFHQEDDKGKGEGSEFFDDEETEYQARKSDDTLSSSMKKEPPQSPQASQTEHTYKPKTQSSPTSVLPPPTDIKNDLTIIFEQYSSLNAIKKLTSSVKQTRSGRKKDKKGKKPYVISSDIPERSLPIKEGDVHEATFRLVSEAEKISEVKDNLKKEINEEILNKINERTSQLEESIGKTEGLKDEILGSIKSVKEELLKSVKEEMESKFEEKKDKDINTRKDEMTKELQDELLTKLDQKILQIEASTQKHSEKIEQLKDSLKDEIHKDLLSKIQEKTTQIEESVGKTESLKEEILNSIKGVKDELLSSLKNEIEDKFKNPDGDSIQEITQPPSIKQNIQKLTETTISEEAPFQEIKQVDFEPILKVLLKEPKVKGTQILDNEGQILAEKWNEQFAIHETNGLQNLRFFNVSNNEINQTNQGNICHILLESENETIVLAKLENKLLTVYTEGTGAIYYGQILRAITSLEESL